MGRARWRLYYHIVWATKNRAPWLEPGIRERILGAIRAKCIELGGSVRELNAVLDHLHLCCEIPPSVAISDAVRDMKGSSSHLANHELGLDYHFRWQEGYGVMSLSSRDVRRTVEYIRDQERHHSTGSVLAPLESTEEEEAAE